MQTINARFVQNLLASYQELQGSYAALQKRMVDFEAMPRLPCKIPLLWPFLCACAGNQIRG